MDHTTTGEVEFGEHRTWFQISGEASMSELDPVIVLHGGPGLAHNGCLPMAGLSEHNRRVVHYDQLGCGRSTHLRDAPASFWTIDLFKQELTNLIEALELPDRFHLLGHSWGGMLGAEYALDHPEGLQSLTICNSPASMPLWVGAAEELLEDLPAPVRETLLEHEEAGTTDSPENVAATAFVYAKHFCRTDPLPANVQASLAQMDEDPTVYHSMNGTSEFQVKGSLRHWTVVDRLSSIDVPTLVISGEHDQATPSTWEPFMRLIPNVRSHVFADASHTPHVEQTDEWLAVVNEFLTQNDSPDNKEVHNQGKAST